jgi:hypothetical protein
VLSHDFFGAFTANELRLSRLDTMDMGACMRARIFSATLVSLMALFAIAPALAQPRTADDIVGVWRGTYSCVQGETALEFRVTQSGDGGLEATFDFSATPRNPSVAAGSYRMSGRALSPTTFLFTPTEWIDRPDGYEMVSLAGIVRRGVFSGEIAHPGCGAFRLTRVRGAARDDAAAFRLAAFEDMDGRGSMRTIAPGRREVDRRSAWSSWKSFETERGTSFSGIRTSATGSHPSQNDDEQACSGRRLFAGLA